MRKIEWWGRARDDAPGAPLHRMVDVPDDVFRRTACTKEPGNGHVVAKSDWTENERCHVCRSAVTERGL